MKGFAALLALVLIPVVFILFLIDGFSERDEAIRDCRASGGVPVTAPSYSNTPFWTECVRP